MAIELNNSRFGANSAGGLEGFAKELRKMSMGSQSIDTAEATYRANEAAAALRNVGAIPNLHIGGNAVYYIGDSIVAYGIASSGGGGEVGTLYKPLIGARAWAAWAMALSDGVIRYAGQSATGGYTSAQILNEHLPNALKSGADYCIISAGTNDLRLEVAEATTIANIYNICDQLRGVGIKPLPMLMPGRQELTAEHLAKKARIHAAIRAYCELHDLPVVDMQTAVANPSTGAWIPGYNYDISHPNQHGAFHMGKAVVKALGPRIAKVYPIRPASATGNGNLVKSGQFDGTDGWTLKGDAVVADTEELGKDLVLVAGQSATQTVTTPASGVVAFNFRFKVEGAAPSVGVYVTQGGNPVAGTRAWIRDTEGYRYMTFEFTSTNASTIINLESTAGTLRVGEVGLYTMA